MLWLAALLLAGCQSTGNGEYPQLCTDDRVCGGGVCDSATHRCTTPDLGRSTGGDMGLPADGCAAGHWCWDNPRPQGNALRSLWVSSATDIWVVGAHGAILHFDGTTWTPTPAGTSKRLNGIWASGPGDAWAVGQETMDPPDYPGIILHWNGTAWSSAYQGALPPLAAIWGSGPADVWTVGPTGTILHYNGAAWTPSPSGVTDNLAAIFGTSATDVWTGGGKNMLHFDGSTWKSVPTQASTASTVGIIWGSGKNDVWAQFVGGPQHWDGTAWTFRSAPTPHWGSGPNDAWSVSAMGVISRWNGTQWLTVPSGAHQWLYDIRGSGPNDVWAAGDGGTLLHWDGLRWTGVLPAGPPTAVNGLWGSGPADLWAVGQDSQYVSGAQVAGGAIMHRSGTTWSAVPAAGQLPNTLLDVWGSGPGDIWAVGPAGAIFHYDGSAWTQAASGTAADLQGVYGSGPGNVWAVGTANVVLSLGNTGWGPLPTPGTPTQFGLRDVWGSGPRDVWVCGLDGLRGILFHWDGTAWASVDTGVPQINGYGTLWGSGTRDVWVTASVYTGTLYSGAILHWDGTRWSTSYKTATSTTGYEIPVPLHLWGTGPSDVWATARTEGSVLHWDGTAWSLIDTGAANDSGTLFGTGGEVFAGGYWGAILRYHP